MLRGLLLDFYGTVVEDDDAVMAAISAQVAASAERPVIAHAVHEMWSREYEAAAAGPAFRSLRDCSLDGLRCVLDQVGCARDPEELCAPQFAHWQAPPLRPGTRAFLDRWRLPVCLVSDADRRDLDAALAHNGLTFDAAVTSDDVGAYKPDTRMFACAAARLGLDAADVVHVGDSIDADVRGAQAAGIAAVWVNRRGQSLPTELRITAELPDLATLADLLEPRDGQGS